MADGRLRLLEREAAEQDSDEALLRLKQARIRYGLEDMPEHWTGLVLDPLHLVQMRKSVAKLNKMLRKKGCLPLTLWESPKAEYIERTRASDGATVRIKVRKVTLMGDMPGSEGRYTFAARLHHLPDATIIHRSRAGRDLPEKVLEDARLAGPWCGHCEKRRGRHDTFIVIDTEQQTTLQVGSTCLQKYTSEDCSAVLYAFEKLVDLTLELNSGDLDDAPVEEYGCTPLAFLAHYGRLERVRAGMIRAQRAVRAQADALDCDLPGRDAITEHQARMLAQLSWEDADADIAAASDLLQRAQAEMLPGLERHRAAQKATGTADATKLLSERDHNIATILESGTVSSREAGTFAAIFQWDSEAEQRRERDRMRRLATDPLAQAAEMATLIGAGASSAAGSIMLSPATLASLLLSASQPALTALATIIANPQALSAPAHDGEYLAAEGAQGTWMLRLERVIEFRSGRGHTLKLTHRGVDGKTRQATIFAGGRNPRKLADLGWAEGDTVEVQATVKEQQVYRGDPGVILAF